ncbi:MAG: metal-dependent hydrolase [Myxococcota bacterium]
MAILAAGSQKEKKLDSITQIALGATIGEAGFRKRLGGRGTIWGGFCGLAPDLDILWSSGDQWFSIVNHRGVTHSLLVIPFAAFAFGYLGRWFGKKKGSYLDWVHLSFWALITHPLLDLCTSYGTMLFAPVSDQRFAIDAVSIIDPIYSLILFLVVALAIRRSRREFAQRAAVVGLVVTTLYLGAGYLWSNTARDIAHDQLIAQGIEPTKIRALPTFFNNRLFRICARDRDGTLFIGYYSLVAPRPIEFVELSPVETEAVHHARATERGQIFDWFSDDLTSVTIDDNGRLVLAAQIYGLYLDRTDRGPFRVAAEPEGDGFGPLEWIPRDENTEGLGDEVDAFWELLTTGSVRAWRTPESVSEPADR